MRRRASLHVTATTLLLVGVATAVSCNAVLDNQPATRARSERTDTHPTSPESTGSDDDVPSNTAGGAKDTATPDPTPECPDGQHLCRGRCVDVDDPTYGCGSLSCT